MVATSLTSMAKSPFFRVLSAQSIVTIFVAFVCLAVSKIAAISVLLAGVSSFLPTLFVLILSLKPMTPGLTGLGQVLRGEAGKFALTIALLTSIFTLVKPLSVAAFFGTFVLMQLCQALVPLVDANRLMKKSLP